MRADPIANPGRLVRLLLDHAGRRSGLRFSGGIWHALQDINLYLVEGTGLAFPLSDWFRASFAIQGPTLNLDVFANTGETDMRMVGNTITRFGSDSPLFGAACFNPGCSRISQG